MGLAELFGGAITVAPGPKPRDDELDLFGLTHPGKVRKENQDHFLLGTIHQQVYVHGTSLPDVEHMPLRSQRLATLMLVADGVGGGAAGAEASRLAADRVARYVTGIIDAYHHRGRDSEQAFYDNLRKAALDAHDAVRAESAARTSGAGGREARRMATTLTVGLAVWPWFYVLQLGDSRCYKWWDGTLTQVTRDQTVAQDLADKGVLPKDKVAASPLASVLASSIGGQAATPEVTRLDITQRGCVLLLCSDGLTKHVSDAEIAEQIGKMTSSEQLCRTLVEMALEDGGSDNVTVLAGRAPLKRA